MTIINNRTNKKIQTAYSTSIVKITDQDVIEDAGDTGHFILPGTPVNNVQPASKTISINLPDGYILRSTHTCNLNIEYIPEKSKLAHRGLTQDAK